MLLPWMLALVAVASRWRRRAAQARRGCMMLTASEGDRLMHAVVLLLVGSVARASGPPTYDCQTLLNRHVALENGLRDYARSPISPAANDDDVECYGEHAYVHRDSDNAFRAESLAETLVNGFSSKVDGLQASAANFNEICAGWPIPGQEGHGGLRTSAAVTAAADDFLAQLVVWSNKNRMDTTVGKLLVDARVVSHVSASMARFTPTPPREDAALPVRVQLDYRDLENLMITKVKAHNLRYTPAAFHGMWNDALAHGVALDTGVNGEDPDGILAGLYNFWLTGTNHITVSGSKESGYADGSYDSGPIHYSSHSGSYGTEYVTDHGVDISTLDGQLTETSTGGTATFDAPAKASAKLRFELDACDANPAVKVTFERFGAQMETWHLPPMPGVTVPPLVRPFLHLSTMMALLRNGKVSFDSLAGAQAFTVSLPLHNQNEFVVDETLEATSTAGDGLATSSKLALKVHHN